MRQAIGAYTKNKKSTATFNPCQQQYHQEQRLSSRRGVTGITGTPTMTRQGVVRRRKKQFKPVSYYYTGIIILVFFSLVVCSSVSYFLYSYSFSRRGVQSSSFSNDRVDSKGYNNLHNKQNSYVNKFDKSEIRRLTTFVESVRNVLYKHWGGMPYDVNNCPPQPPDNYPIEWPILDVLSNWKPNDIPEERKTIYQGLCRFNYQKEFYKALAYRRAEKPFILRDDPQILKVVERWSKPNYLSSVLGEGVRYMTEYSESNHLMFYRTKKGEGVFERQRKRHRNRGEEWVPPIQKLTMTYDEWLEKANQPKIAMGPDKPHWYFRVNAKKENGTKNHRPQKLERDSSSVDRGNVMYDELPFFQPEESFYIVDPTETRGINCRFGMMGNIAECHYDSSRNFIVLLGGERRYILSHPKNCPNLALYPFGHPSARHTKLDWSDIDMLEHFFEEGYEQNNEERENTKFSNAMVNEVVLQAGDALYLPTNWFHHIISLGLNWQCNARSGSTKHYNEVIHQCGFNK